MVWPAEFTGRHVGNGPKGYSICCTKGKVQLPLLQETPPELLGILTYNERQSRVFFNKSHVYNNIFAFCSFGGTIDDSVNKGKGPYVFRVSGQTYHNFGSLMPPDGCFPKFAQLYMYDGQEATDHQVTFPRNRDDVDPSIVETLQNMLECDNCLVGIFKQVRLRFNDAE
ncbi:ATP-dependent DNA helicase PIF1 [Heracleum sosnowskyi]|uniref:ATP-dependent DNA helicase PIF1 n=1 Tax=Heracleum sosnowskyi TaxID=360622 RepID=A0AAD8JFD8_9APIA|nr:ATP-dependent DNA helicase PIF1 [Heracleum sosnowskyi]